MCSITGDDRLFIAPVFRRKLASPTWECAPHAQGDLPGTVDLRQVAGGFRPGRHASPLGASHRAPSTSASQRFKSPTSFAVSSGCVDARSLLSPISSFRL